MPDVLVRGRPIQSLWPILKCIATPLLSLPTYPLQMQYLYDLHVNINTAFVTIPAPQVFGKEIVRDDCPEKNG